MSFVRMGLVLAVMAGFVGAPLARAVAEETAEMERVPAAAKKKKKKAAKKPAKHAAKKKKKAAARHAAPRPPKSHAPKASAMPAAPVYPTQPNAGFSDIPNEKKDDLPPPAAPAND